MPAASWGVGGSPGISVQKAQASAARMPGPVPKNRPTKAITGNATISARSSPSKGVSHPRMAMTAQAEANAATHLTQGLGPGPDGAAL